MRAVAYLKLYVNKGLRMLNQTIKKGTRKILILVIPLFKKKKSKTKTFVPQVIF
jgi:hypothetical protein